jgi:hypothetical protein
MPRPAFAQTLKRTRKELERLRVQRAAIDTRIAKLQQVEAALSGATEPERGAPDLSSITDVVRNVLKTIATQPITPIEIRDKMLAMGFNKAKYSQFLASVHVILKRLTTNGEAFEFTFRDGKRYWWVKRSMPGGPLPENAMLGNYYNSYRDEDLTSPFTYEEAKAKEAAKYRR